MGIVCRSINMYNEYVPAISGQREWQYQVLGHHDGMEVCAPVYINTINSFQSLYNECIENEQVMDYAVQKFYGLHEDDGREEEFWNEKYIFTFVSFIQFKEKRLEEYRKYLEEQTFVEAEADKLKVRAYYALDYNDCIVVVRSNKIEKGMQFICTLHDQNRKMHPFEISNSYSVLTFDKYYTVEANQGDKVEGIIDKVELRIVGKYPNSAGALYDELIRQLSDDRSVILNRYAVLGMDDEIILIENIPYGRFLQLYANDSGILCNSNATSQRYASSVTTKVLYKNSENECSKAYLNKEKTGEKEFCDILNRYIQQCYENRISMFERVEKKTLLKITNELGKIEYARNENMAIMEYNFFTLLIPFYFFIKLHMSSGEHSDEYYEFLTYFNMCTQNYDKLDRVFLQSADFNTRYFEMQTKYFALYNAFIYRLKQVLNNGGNKKYEFVLYPGMSERTEVIEFHKQEDDRCRLFRVEIAETDRYDIKTMLCILGHEVAHVVGTQIRSRDNRYEHMLKMNSHVIVMGIQYCFENLEPDRKTFDDAIWKDYEEKCIRWLEQYLARNDNARYWETKMDLENETRDIIEQYIAESSEYKKYTDNMKDAFEMAMKDMIRLQGIELFEDIIWILFEEELENKEIEYGDKEEFIEHYQMNLKKAIDIMTGEGREITDTFDFAKVLDLELYLLRECYADLISILSLQITLKEYLDIIMKEALNVGYDPEKFDDIIIARIAIVMVTMRCCDDGKSDDRWMWPDEELLDQCAEKLLMLQKQALDFMWIYIDNSISHVNSNLLQDSECIIFDHVILREIILYLLHCKEAFYKNIQKEELEVIGRFKGVADYCSADKFYTVLMQLLAEYEQDVYSELTETKKNIEEHIQREQEDGKATDRKY